MTRKELQKEFKSQTKPGYFIDSYIKWLEYKIIGTKNAYLPPAEGAEEIFNKYQADAPMKTRFINFNEAIKAMQEFATLHAQRIAEKIVEENLVEFGNMIRDEPNGDIAALAEYFIRTINLKSREK